MPPTPARTSTIASRPRIRRGSGKESAPPGVMSFSTCFTGPFFFVVVGVVVIGAVVVGFVFVDDVFVLCVVVLCVVVAPVPAGVAVVFVCFLLAITACSARLMSSAALE